MYLRQFQYLIGVIEEGHFGRAAARCNATQPSLSTGIKKLELELGVPIFLRGRGHRLNGLTAEGHLIVKWARLITSHCDAMRDELDAMRGDLHGDLRIGAMPSVSPVLPFILKTVRASFPNVRVDVSFIGQEAMRVGLDSFSLDVAIFYLDSDTLGRRNAISLYSETLSLLVPDTESFAGRTEITWEEASRLPLAMLDPSTPERRFVDQVFNAIGAQPVPKVESESILHLMFQVQFAELCTIVPTHFARRPGPLPGTRALKLIEPVRNREVGLFWVEADTIMPMAGVMVAIIRALEASQELKRLLADPSPHPQPDTRQQSAAEERIAARPGTVHPLRMASRSRPR
jgi:DNA-binding transcriptional LysR family regulator